MTTDNRDQWKKLAWETKVSICEQARASENYLLHAYIVTFMAIQAVSFALFAAFWNVTPLLRFIIPFVGIMFAALWAYMAESRGNKVDLWEEMLNGLWEETSQAGSVSSEVVGRYKGAAERRQKREADRLATFWGWGCIKGRFKSARWIFVMFFPSFLTLIWIFLVVLAAVVFACFAS